MKKNLLFLLPLLLAALACTLTNEVRTTITTGATSTPTPAPMMTEPGNTQTVPPPTPYHVSTRYTPAPTVCVVTSHALTLRAGPGADFPALNYLTQGDPLTITEHDAAGWWKVTTQTGVTGYINSTYCNAPAPTTAGQEGK